MMLPAGIGRQEVVGGAIAALFVIAAISIIWRPRTPFPAMTENGFHHRLANAVKKASP